jgi:hypothetical protein
MRKIRQFKIKSSIFYSLIIGFIVCFLANNCLFLSLVEKAVKIKFNPLQITDWMWIFMGS